MAVYAFELIFHLLLQGGPPRSVSPAMWSITLVKMTKAPNPQEAEAMNKRMQEAAQKLGVKIHNGSMTLGRYDAVWISEAPYISGPMKVSTMGADVGHSETLVATSYEEAMKWIK